MAGWLMRAASAFGRKTSPPPQPFDLPCDCGERHTGWRTESHQKLNCTHCDRPLLVLPADVYPAVKRPTAAKIHKKPPAVVHPEEQESAVASRRKKSASRTPKPSEKLKSSVSQEAASSAAKPEKTLPPTDDRIDLSPILQQARTRRRTLRLVVASMLALVFATGWSLWNRTQREQARAAIPPATEAGLAALHSGDFAIAARELTIAVNALDTLRRHDATARTTRQAHREAVAADRLASVELADLAREVLAGSGTPEERQRRFQAEYGTQWLIFDVGVVSRTAGDKPVTELDVPLTLVEKTTERPLQVRCDFPDLRRLTPELDAQNPIRVIIAGQLDEWLLPDALQGPIIARIKPGTAFLWTDYDSYRAVGYQPYSVEAEQETRSLLNRQRQQERAP